MINSIRYNECDFLLFKELLTFSLLMFFWIWRKGIFKSEIIIVIIHESKSHEVNSLLYSMTFYCKKKTHTLLWSDLILKNDSYCEMWYSFPMSIHGEHHNASYVSITFVSNKKHKKKMREVSRLILPLLQRVKSIWGK